MVVTGTEKYGIKVRKYNDCELAIKKGGSRAGHWILDKHLYGGVASLVYGVV